MRTTVSLPDDLATYVDENFASDDESDAQAVRDAIQHARELEDSVEKLRSQIDAKDAEIDELESELERVKNEKRLILEEREEHTQLVRAVEQERTLQERRAQAGLAQRAKWWLLGMDGEQEA